MCEIESYYRENLQLITDFLESNCIEALWDKVIVAQKEYPKEQ
jgi:hypothetical protein